MQALYVMKYHIKQRFAVIETLAYWGGGTTAAQLGAAFGIARENAQRTLDQYRRLHPGQITYDARKRRQVAEEDFSPSYIHPGAGAFLDHQRGLHACARYEEVLDVLTLEFTDIETFVPRRRYAGILRPVVTALRERQSLVIRYQGRKGQSVRRISPHRLVWADDRYHLRAYCELREGHRDFVLSRILEAGSPDAETWVAPEKDRDWQERADLFFGPNPDLPPHTQAMLRLEYGLEGDVLRVRGVPRALASYVERRFLRVDPLAEIPLWLRMEQPRMR